MLNFFMSYLKKIFNKEKKSKRYKQNKKKQIEK